MTAKLPKISKFFLWLAVFLLLLPFVINAAEKPFEYKAVEPKLQIPIPNVELTKGIEIELKGAQGANYVEIPWLGQYISGIYQYFLGIAGILAVIMVVIAGVLWLTAGGAPGRIQQAQGYIFNAIIGLVLLFGSYFLLWTINPELVKFSSLKIPVIKPVPFLIGEIGYPCETQTPSPPGEAELVSISGDNITTGAMYYGSPQLRAETLEKLQLAAKLLEKKSKKLQINNAFRTAEQQLTLYTLYADTRHVCTPCKSDDGKTYLANCPHMRGQAVDAVCEGKSSNDDCQKLVKEAMACADFCRLGSEAWHFEYPALSSNCVKEACPREITIPEMPAPTGAQKEKGP